MTVATLEQKVDTQQLIKGLKNVWLELTLRCNLSCVHCYAESGPNVERERLTLENWYDVIDQTAELGVQSFILIGGEATLNRDLLKIIDHIRGRGIEIIEVYTNLTVVTPRILKEYADRKVMIATSFYSHRPEIHEKITQTPGSYSKTLTNIKAVLSLGMPLRVGIIAMPINEQDVPHSVDFLIDLGVPKNSIGVDRVRGVGRGQSFIQESNLDALCGSCWKGNLCVSCDGSVFPCVFARDQVIGNVQTQRVESMLNSNHLWSFRRSIFNIYTDRLNTQGACNPWECPPDQMPCVPRQCRPGP